MLIYLIGSLRNPEIPQIGNKLRAAGFEVFDDWYGAGHEADDQWQAYERLRERTFAEALAGHAAQHVFHFDKTHILRADAVMLILPAGKSGHLEFGFARGAGKPGVILMPGEPERFDVMYNFASLVTQDLADAVKFFEPYRAQTDAPRELKAAPAPAAGCIYKPRGGGRCDYQMHNASSICDTCRRDAARLAAGCCSASSPCIHQKKHPESICDTCQRAARDPVPEQRCSDCGSVSHNTKNCTRLD